MTGERSNPSYPIWDNRTTTTDVANGTGDVDITIGRAVYYIIFSVSGSIGAGRIFVRDDTATTASTGIQVEDAAPGDSTFGIHTEPGAIIRVTRPASSGFSYTQFYNY